MKVILRKDVEKLGRAGDVKDVKPGFARNYLIARSLAQAATEATVRANEKGKEKRAALRQKAASEAVETAKKLSGVSLSYTRPAGEGGKLFGSVGKADIAKSLKASGYSIDKDAVRLESAIKTAGDHEVEVRLSAEAAAKIKVSVLPRA